MTFTFPIPVIWRHPLQEFFLPRHAPFLGDELLTIRCGDRVIQLSSKDVSKLWSLQIDTQAGDGNFFLRIDDLFVTDFHRQPDRLSSVMALSLTGTYLWRLDLQSIIGTHGACMMGSDLLVLATEPGTGCVIHVIDVRLGICKLAYPVRWGAQRILPLADGRILLGNRFTEDGSPGLYTTWPDGREPRKIDDRSVWFLERRQRRILAVTRTSMKLPRTVRVMDEQTLAEIWAAPAASEVAEGDEKAVYSTEILAGKEFLSSRSLENGEVLWRTDPLPDSVLSIDCGGSLLFCGRLGGAQVFEVSDGRPLGELRGLYGPATAEAGRLYLAGDGAILCALLPT